MDSSLSYLKSGLSRNVPIDRITGRNAASDIKSNFKNLHPFLTRHWRKGMLGAALILAASLLSIPQPLIFRYVVDNVILGRQLGLLAGAVIFLGGISLAQKLAMLLQDFFFARLEQEVLLDVRTDLFDRALHFPKSFFDKNETGYLMSRLSSDIQELQSFFSATMVHVVGNCLRLLGGIGVLFYLEWRLAAGALVILPGIALSMRYFSQKLLALSHQSMEKEARVNSQLQESLTSVSLIKAFSTEARTSGRLMSALKDAFQIAVEKSMVHAVSGLAVSSIPGIARAVVLIIGAFLIIEGDWSLGSLLAFQAYLSYVFGPAQYLAAVNLQLQQSLAALGRVSAIYDIVPEENMGTGIRVNRIKGEIEFKGVGFSYDRHEPILEGIEFRISPGQHAAIVGPSGAGKTTLVSLILRFYRPTAGEIYFDGRPASSYDVGSLRERMGYVSQRTLLLSGTIMENLRYGNPEVEAAQVVLAAKAADIHDFIDNLPEGYETKIGEIGVGLSEGQKQRLSIARALVKDPDILVLDEPSSALDNLTEKTIFQALPALIRNKTLFVVTNRIATMRATDHIFLLNKNRLAAAGSFTSLLESNDDFRSLVQPCDNNADIDSSLNDASENWQVLP